MEDSAADGEAPRRQRWKIDLLLVLAVLCLSVPFFHDWTAQPASRYLFTAAVVDDHSLRLDPYRNLLGVDHAIVDGHVYSDKAPYQPLMSAPAYWLYRAGGGEPLPRDVKVSMLHRVDIGLWMVTLMSATIPAVILTLLIRRHVSRTFPTEAVVVVLSLMFGTVLLPFSSLLFGHMLAATTGFAAWFLLRRARVTNLALVGVGVLLGASIGVEYTQAIVAAVLGVYAIVTLRQRALWVVLGGAVGVAPLLVFNAFTWGGPFKTAYQGYLPNFQGSGALGVYNLVVPDGHEFGLALFGPRGLLSLTPIMLMAVAGCILAIRRKGASRPDAIVALILLGLFLLATTGIDGYGGDSPGPRYLVPILPFFAVPLAEAWRSWRKICVVTAVWSAFWMILATITDPIYKDNAFAPGDWIHDFFNGQFEHSILGELTSNHAASINMVPIAVACAAGALYLDRRARQQPRRSKPVESLETT